VTAAVSLVNAAERRSYHCERLHLVLAVVCLGLHSRVIMFELAADQEQYIRLALNQAAAQV
jgi:hypothetical protein